MRMMSARYINDEQNSLINLREMTTKDYENIYKGFLFCPTKGCFARVTYSGGNTPHFRTWKLEEHKSGCLHEFDRIPIRRGVETDNSFSVDIGYDRRQNALKDAFKLMNMTNEELKEQKKKKSERKKTNPTVQGKVKNADVKTTLVGGELTEEITGFRGRNLSKRYVDTISNSDIGEIRLVMGEVTGIRQVDNVAKIFIERNDVRINVVFEEAFIAEPSNSSYLNKFGAIEKYIDDYEEVQFTGIGEIRRNIRTEELELVIYSGTDFKIDNADMVRIFMEYNEE